MQAVCCGEEGGPLESLNPAPFNKHLMAGPGAGYSDLNGGRGEVQQVLISFSSQ